jgi:hypothetical protein
MNVSDLQYAHLHLQTVLKETPGGPNNALRTSVEVAVFGEDAPFIRHRWVSQESLSVNEASL